jgi:hypothetical protein
MRQIRKFFDWIILIVSLHIAGQFLAEWRWWLIPAGVFALTMVVAEIHHVVKTIMHWTYFPGAVTAVPLSIVGSFLLRAVVTQHKAVTPGRAELVQ